MENIIKTSTPLTSEHPIREKSKDYNILVYLRVRPLVKNEYGKEVAITCDDDVVLLKEFYLQFRTRVYRLIPRQIL